MSTSNNIGLALVAGFIVYITVRGELPAYLCVIGIGSNCPPVGTTTVQQQSSSAPATVNNYYSGVSAPSSGTNPPANTGGTISTPPSSVNTGYNPPTTPGTSEPPQMGIVTTGCFDMFGVPYDCQTGAYDYTGGGGAGSSPGYGSPTGCYDVYGNPIDCSSQAYGSETNGYGCTDANGNPIDCGSYGAIGGY